MSLRKFITGVNDTKVASREPVVDTTPLKNGTGTTAKYEHTKEPIRVPQESLVTYTIRIYNEGKLDAYAAEIKDYLPSELEFVVGNEINKKYGWVKVSDREIKTTYLKDTKLNKYNGGDNLSYADVEVVCKVKEDAEVDKILVNLTEISKYLFEDEKGNKLDIQKDVDSTSNNIQLPSESDWSKYEGKPIKITKTVPKTVIKKEKKTERKTVRIDLAREGTATNCLGFTGYHFYKFKDHPDVVCPGCKYESGKINPATNDYYYGLRTPNYEGRCVAYASGSSERTLCNG